jgi:hypothetical protein
MARRNAYGCDDATKGCKPKWPGNQSTEITAFYETIGEI